MVKSSEYEELHAERDAMQAELTTARAEARQAALGEAIGICQGIMEAAREKRLGGQVMGATWCRYRIKKLMDKPQKTGE